MKKILLLLVAFFCLANSYGQTNLLKDSLTTLLKKERQDTSRALLLAALSRTYALNKPDTAITLALEALSLSQRIAFAKGEVASLSGIGNAYRAIGNLPKAMGAYLQALKLSEKISHSGGIGLSLHDIGTIYIAQGEYHKAIYYLLKSQKLHKEINKYLVTNGMSEVRLGNSYFGLKQYDTARVYTQQAYEKARKLNNPFATGVALTLMGDIYTETGQRKLALEYYRLSIPYNKLGNELSLTDTFLGIAKLFANEGQMDSTLFYANQAFEISRGAGFTLKMRDVSSLLSSFYENRGNTDRALFYLKIASAAKDSLSSQQRINQLKSLDFDEKLRQQEIAMTELKTEEDKRHNLQFAALAIGLITFIILFFALSRSIIVKTKFIEFFGILGLLAVFEFINLFIHPYLAHATNDSPVLMLLVLIVIGGLLVPLHHKLEKWITKIMVEKNKKIRLDAARKTIANLEGAPVT
ncbi:lipopolysaccharide assembly protein LapB [Daejeonella sp.]|uniref:tetratricopeptide repeat protein n=1 Tax=Daejeonella sp. TaxID=2805397 RepID=UPI00272F9064|nr:tetratricopeptide repeat protein [Daejeonella sp.]MDP2414986.1 tetratricopeptide repeat protein [Daejeonella sp.]